MASRMHTTPLLVQDGGAVPLNRVSLNEKGFSESWLQKLLFENPSLIPVSEIEPVFAPPIPVAREVSTPSGPLDILYVSSEGYPTIVETKLWRNPEARRVVVAQIIDYATQLSKWSYTDLVSAARASERGSGGEDPLISVVREHAGEFNEPQFIDTLHRNLQRGRMLLLIVGDGIHESLEQMAELLSRSPQLGFTLALVELAIYRRSGCTEPLIVQPRIVGRTREVLRAIVEVRGSLKPGDIDVYVPPEKPPGGNGITREVLMEKLASILPLSLMDQFRSFLAEVEELGMTLTPGKSSLSLHYFEPSMGSRISCGFIRQDGAVDMHYVLNLLKNSGLDEQIGREYLDTVAALVPGARVEIVNTKGGTPAAIRVNSEDIGIADLLPRRSAWLEAIQRMISGISAAVRSEERA